MVTLASSGMTLASSGMTLASSGMTLASLVTLAFVRRASVSLGRHQCVHIAAFCRLLLTSAAKTLRHSSYKLLVAHLNARLRLTLRYLKVRLRLTLQHVNARPRLTLLPSLRIRRHMPSHCDQAARVVSLRLHCCCRGAESCCLVELVPCLAFDFGILAVTGHDLVSGTSTRKARSHQLWSV